MDLLNDWGTARPQVVNYAKHSSVLGSAVLTIKPLIWRRVSSCFCSTRTPKSKIGGYGPKILNTDGSIQISVWHNPPSALPPTASGKD